MTAPEPTAFRLACACDNPDALRLPPCRRPRDACAGRRGFAPAAARLSRPLIPTGRQGGYPLWVPDGQRLRHVADACDDLARHARRGLLTPPKGASRTAELPQAVPEWSAALCGLMATWSLSD